MNFKNLPHIITKMSNRTEKYNRVDQITHILTRPDTYVGNKKAKRASHHVLKKNPMRIELKEISVSPAMIRIFVEALSNAIDNQKRSLKSSTKTTKIKITIDPDTGRTTVWNDGLYIPIDTKYDAIDKKDRYVHSMVFGSLHTSSNYDDDEERDVSGRNGLGIKLCNVLSTEFTVSGADPELGKTFTQTWTNNMRDVQEPIVKSKKVAKGFTEVSWVPDFEWFGTKGYSQDIIRLFSKYVYDAAMITNIPIYLNEECIKIKSLKDYAELYRKSTDEKEEILSLKDSHSDVVICSSDGFEQISFVNGVYTSLGGKHVDAWSEAIFRPIVTKFNKKDKPQININHVKENFKIFVNSTVSNPEFESQSKHRLESPEVSASVSAASINKICKWSIAQKIKDHIESKELLSLKKTASKRGKSTYTKIEGLDPANKSGGMRSSECTLIICEGKSAKSYAVSGISVGAYGKTGRDWFGIYPVRGKILNVRKASMKAIADNKVVADIINALGISYEKDYTIDENFKKLRYGKIMYLTDADVDGIHIASLGLNLFMKLFPTLFKRDEPFIVKMETPIAKVFTNPPRIFFDEREYNEFMLKTNNKHKAKYYKGLGTSDAAEVAETFGLKINEFTPDEKMDKYINLVFDDKQADGRKKWIANHKPNSYKDIINNDRLSQMSISNYLNNFTVLFSIADNKRSLPNMMDGLKESQRKILYACFKRKLTSPVKVAQLSGYVSEHTNYHHGEESLNGAIIGMASSFVGGNNIPYLTRNGFFGSRLEGGKDAAKPRYIFTQLEKITRIIFPEEDDCLLPRVVDDGDIVEPEYYMPIIPMALINSTEGIGTGWSCSMPSFNPEDVVNCVKYWIEHETLYGDDGKPLLDELIPWYRGYKGVISKIAKNKYESGSIIDSEDPRNIKISELPIGVWTTTFKEKVEDLIMNKSIKKMNNYSTPTEVNIEIVPLSDKKFYPKTMLPTTKTISTGNMVFWNDDNKICKYDNAFDIIEEFCLLRYSYYIDRKEYQLKKLEENLLIITQKRKFIMQVMDGKIVVFRKKKAVLEAELEKKGYEKDVRKESEGNYNYLIKLPVSTFTEEELKKLEEEYITAKKRLAELQNTTEKQLWLNDLDKFMEEYTELIEKLKDESKSTKKTRKSKK